MRPEMTTGARAARDEKVVRLTLAGASLADVGEATGLTLSGVRDARRRLGIQGNPRNPLSTEMLRRARDLLGDGCSYAEVARTLGVGIATICRHFPGKGWTPTQAADHRRALRDFAEGQPESAIAAMWAEKRALRRSA